MARAHAYEPKLEHGLPNEAASESFPEEGWNWVQAPATSHIYQFAFRDLTAPENARLAAFQKKFPSRFPNLSTMVITFRDEKTRGKGPTYAYFFHDAAQGRALLAELAASPHPYAEVFYPKMRNNGSIPYTNMAGMI